MKINGKKAMHLFSVVCLTVLAVICVVPFMMVISASLSSEGELVSNGYKLLPQGFTLASYKELLTGFKNPKAVIPRAYVVTMFNTALSTILMVVLVTLSAYPLCRKTYRWKTIVTIYWLIPMLFGGGEVANYIHLSRNLGLLNSIWVLIWPGCFSAWNAFLIRGFMSQVDTGYIEAAKIDGASEFQILFKIFAPMAKPGLAVITMKTILANWNEWYACMLYMPDDKYMTIQRYLQKILSNISMMKTALATDSGFITDMANIPSESLRMAICVVAAGPMIFVFMFFQKYFVKGISIGGIKG